MKILKLSAFISAIKQWWKKSEKPPIPQKKIEEKVPDNELTFEEYKERIKTILKGPKFRDINVDVDKLSSKQILLIKNVEETRVFKDRVISRVDSIISEERNKEQFMIHVRIKTEHGVRMEHVLFREYIILSDVDIKILASNWDSDVQRFTIVTPDKKYMSITFTSGCCC